MQAATWQRSMRTGPGLLLLVGAVAGAGEMRIKDIATVSSTAGYHLVGYGLVTGLNGTGDTKSTYVTLQSIVNMLRTLNVTVQAQDLNLKNCASVVVEATLPPAAKRGMRVDLTVTSIGDAKSLEGGRLIITPLLGGDRQPYVEASGDLSLGGGYSAGGGGATATKNHVTVGKIPGGGLVVLDVPAAPPSPYVSLFLHRPDFTTATRVADVINEELGERTATAVDDTTINVQVRYSANVPEFVQRIENLKVEPDAPARVVIDERNGTIVFTNNVRILPAAVAAGGISVVVQRRLQVSQPEAPLTGGQTVVVPEDTVSVEEEPGSLATVPEQASLGDLVEALNALGLKPRALIAILRALKEAGALQAELVIM